MNELIQRLLNDPPAVHDLDEDGRERGVWSADASLYDLLAARCRPGMRTAETGTGISTLVFASAGTDHVAVTPAVGEPERLLTYADERGIAMNRVAFELGLSRNVLPRLAGPLDLVLVDGAHGFPDPVLDWAYLAPRLVRGGVFVLDDVHLPTVGMLARILMRDPRWQVQERHAKWIAWEALEPIPEYEEWDRQPHLRSNLLQRARFSVKRAGEKLRVARAR